jgi:hypothetical protein
VPAASPPPIPPDREDGSSTFLHRLFVLTGWVGALNPAWLLPLGALLIGLVALAWRTDRLTPAFLALLFLAADWITLTLLPVIRRSWGPVTPSLLALTLLRAALSWALALVAPTLMGLSLLFALNLALSLVVIYATWVEPFRLRVTHQSLSLPGLRGDRPLRLLHISDLHFEGFSPREQAVLEQVERLHPDLIVLTGDYLNLSSVHDAEAQAGARELLAKLRAPLGVYAVTGSTAVDVEGIVPEIFEGLEMRWLLDEATSVETPAGDLWLVGVRCKRDLERDGRALREALRSVPEGARTLLLYHSPDLMPLAAEAGVDLYLAGHTHGGQLRLPLYGALFTSSDFGKRYEQGRFVEGKTTLYVSRGLGLEGLGAPRARFLAPPEVVVWEIG